VVLAFLFLADANWIAAQARYVFTFPRSMAKKGRFANLDSIPHPVQIDFMRHIANRHIVAELTGNLFRRW
jgi:hypothetical protein